jgi:hypothetical protein
MDPRIIFLCPPSVAKLADEVANRSGRIDGIVSGDVKEAESLLRDRVGYIVEIVFPQPLDPLNGPADAVEAIASATHGGHYLYIVDAWKEQTRDIRVPGRIVFRDGGRERTLTIPQEKGSPALDLPTLLAGGLNIDEARDVMSKFLVT